MAELPQIKPIGTAKIQKIRLKPIGTAKIGEDPKRIFFNSLPDVGSIQPLTEAEKRKAFGTPLTRALKMDPISLERSPIKRGIASIGSNILDMLPGFSLQKGIEEGDPVQMGMGITDLIPGAALLKVGSKAVTDLANKLARMSPKEIAAVKQQYNRVFRNIYEQQERIINSAGATNADKAAAREVQRKINANYSIMFDNAGKKFSGIPDNVFYAPTKNLDELKKLSPKDSKKVLENIKKEKRSIKRMPEVQMYGPKEKAEVFRDIDDEFKEAINILNQNINKKLKEGGPVDKPLYDDQRMI